MQFNCPVSKIEDFTLRHFAEGDFGLECNHCGDNSVGHNEKARFTHILKGCEAYGDGDVSRAMYDLHTMG